MARSKGVGRAILRFRARYNQRGEKGDGKGKGKGELGRGGGFWGFVESCKSVDAKV